MDCTAISRNSWRRSFDTSAGALPLAKAKQEPMKTEEQTLDQPAEELAQAPSAPAAAAPAEETEQRTEEESAPEESATSQEDSAPKKGGLLAGVFAVRKDRQGLLAEIADLRSQLKAAKAEGKTLRAENERLRAEVEEGQAAARELEQLQAEVRTTEQGVQAELEAIGVPEAEAPEALGDAKPTLAELEQRLESEKDPAERARVWAQIKRLEREDA